MKSVKSILGYLLGIITILSFGITIYLQFIHEDIVEMEVKTIDKTQLTNVPDTDGLTVRYRYQDSIVNNLWKIRYVISNIGTKTIIAEGINKNILSKNLHIAFNDSVKILSVNIDKANFPISAHNDFENIITLNFKQWKKTEFIDIVVIIENFTKTDPFIFLDERDIIDSKVVFSEYKPNERNDKKKLIDYLPKGLATFLKWSIVSVICIMDILAIIAINKQLKEDLNINSSKWIKMLTFIIWLIITIIFSIPLLWIF